jgi:2,3-bisphosphoglycerate-dependent phosphoglycerate mutase
MAKKHNGVTLLLVSHGNAIALYLNSIEPSFGYDGWAAMKNPDVFRVVVGADASTWDKDWKFN